MAKRRILLTGGHLSPAFSVLAALKKANYDIIFVGRKHAFSDAQDLSLEYQLLESASDLHFYSLHSGRLTRGSWLSFPKELVKTTQAYFKAKTIITKERPEVVLSFGGYLALPVCLAAAHAKIPIFLHEQTVSPGRSNLLLAKLAQRVLVSFPQARSFFPQDKVKVKGMVLRPELEINKRPGWFKESELPLLLIMGGSAGSHSLNLLIESVLTKLTADFAVVHQTGDSKYEDYDRLRKKTSDNYYPLKYLLPEELGYLYRRANIVISRSGANTFFELIKFKKPSVLVPLPWSANNEQLRQARILEDNEVAKIFHQDQEKEQFLKIIYAVYSDQERLTRNYHHLAAYAKLIIDPKELLKELNF